MAVIRPLDLPAASSVSDTDVLIVDKGSAVEKATPAQVVEAAIPLASQAEAEAGSDNTKRVTPLRVKQAIEALGFDSAVLADAAGASGVGFIQSGTGAVARTAQAKMRETVSVLDFGAVGDGVTNNDAALAAVRTYAALRSFAGNTVQITWPAGRYLYTTSENWAIERLVLQFEGEVWLIRTGTGPAFILDGGATGDGVFMSVLGFPHIYDDGVHNHGIYARAIHDGQLQFNCRGAGPGFAGLYGVHLVDNDIDFKMTGLEGGLYKIPSYALYLTTRGVNPDTGIEEETSFNIIRVRISGFALNLLPIGMFYDGALGNKTYGSVQNCTLAYKDTTNAWLNKHWIDFESNIADAEVHGEGTVFDSHFTVGPVFKSDAVNCKMVGGSTFNVTVEPGAQSTLLKDFDYNRLRVGGTGIINPDYDPSTRFRDLTNGKTGEVHDAPPSRTALTVGASPYTYTNTTGNDVLVIVSGGTVSSIVLTRTAGDPVGITSGQFALRPGDAMTVTYSVAPTMARWT
jgi:hypothetical protein